jgi:hypothetical protein
MILRQTRTNDKKYKLFIWLSSLLSHMKHFLLLASFTLFVILGCESETPTANNPDSNDTGTVTGYILTTDIFGSYNNLSGTKITLQGTNISAYSDSMSNWTLSGVPEGNYIGILSRDGYVSRKIYNVHVFGNSVTYYDITQSKNEGLYPLPNFLHANELVIRQFEDHKTITSRDTLLKDSLGVLHTVTIKDTIIYSNGIAKFTLKASMPIFSSGGNKIMQYTPHVMCSRSAQFDAISDRSSTVEFTSSSLLQRVVEGRDSSCEINIYKGALLNAGFKPGDVVYARGYVSAYRLVYYEYNPFKRTYEPDVLSSNCTPIYSFTVPN